jgi:integrase
VVNTVASRLIRFRTPVKKLPRVLKQSDVAKVIAHTREPRDRAVLEVLYATGCRTSEIVNMRVEQIDFRREEIRILGKRRERVVYFGQPAERALLRYLGKRRDGVLFQDLYQRQKGYLVHVGLRWYACWSYHPKSGPPLVRRYRFLGESQGRAAVNRSEAEHKFRRVIHCCPN